MDGSIWTTVLLVVGFMLIHALVHRGTGVTGVMRDTEIMGEEAMGATEGDERTFMVASRRLHGRPEILNEAVIPSSGL